VTTIRCFLFLLLLTSLGAAQSAPADMSREIERQVRSYFTLPISEKVKVGAIKPANDIPGFDAVSVGLDAGNGKGPKEYTFLLSKDRRTMFSMTKFDLTRDPFEEVMAKIDIDGRPTRGAKSAKVVVVNFDDLECPFCAQLHHTLFPEILKEYGDRVKFVYKDYPLTDIHPWAMRAAVDANCLAAQDADAYWDFADYIHANKRDVDEEKTPDAQLGAVDRITLLEGQKHNLDPGKLRACVAAQNEDAVRASIKEAEAVGVGATPVLFVNGQRINGAVSAAEIRGSLDAVLKDAERSAPERASSIPGTK
jgi:protein-disulfide isomerase